MRSVAPLSEIHQFADHRKPSVAASATGLHHFGGSACLGKRFGAAAGGFASHARDFPTKLTSAS
jgi:hypothetical protein